MADFKQQRINMVESQVRPSDVTDRRIIRAMLEIPREAFVPAAVQSIAYMDQPVRVAGGNGSGEPRYLLAPRTLAKLVQLAEIGPQSAVLDVGVATGYSSALLARIAARVVGVEVDPALAAAATANLERMGCSNVRIVQGPLQDGVKAEAPFDAILLNGAVQEVGQALLDQLKIGGRLVGVLATGPFGRAQVWQRSAEAVSVNPAFDAAAPGIPGFASPPGFVF
jgi:protein-L-isoaspartate(D-aspartate) O-methyltransferase